MRAETAQTRELRARSFALEHQKGGRESRAERAHQAASRRHCFSHSMQHKQGGRRRHVSIIAQYGAAFGKTAARKIERVFKRIQNLGTTGMASEAIDAVARNIIASQKTVRDLAKIAGDERWNALGEPRLEPVLLDFPSHDVERVGPSVAAARADFGPVGGGC